MLTRKATGGGRPALQNNDQPLHTSYRALVNEAFRPKRIRQMEDYVEGIVAELIDAIVEAGGEADVVHDFSVPLPLIVISDQLGVPREMYRTFKEWSDAWLAGLGTELTDEQHIANAHTVIEMQKYLAGRIEERRATPQDDILSDLAQADVNGGKLDTATILSIVEQLLVAGNETTTNGIAAGLYALSQDQDLHRRAARRFGSGWRICRGGVAHGVTRTGFVPARYGRHRGRRRGYPGRFDRDGALRCCQPR